MLSVDKGDDGERATQDEGPDCPDRDQTRSAKQHSQEDCAQQMTEGIGIQKGIHQGITIEKGPEGNKLGSASSQGNVVGQIVDSEQSSKGYPADHAEDGRNGCQPGRASHAQ